MTSEVAAPVLVVGGGPVGLGLAIELGRWGVPVQLIEARDGTPTVPKMTQVHARTLEVCRRWGIADQVFDAGFPKDQPQDFIYVTTMVGRELFRVPRPSYVKQPSQANSPVRDYQTPQLYFDPILRGYAETLSSVMLSYFTRLDRFAEEADRVVAHVTDMRSGEPSTITCRYLLGCDGAQSVVRGQLGIGMGGAGHLDRSVSIFFRSAALKTLHHRGWGRFYRVNDTTGCWAEMVAVNGDDLWRLSILIGGDPDLPFDPEQCLLRAVGKPFAHEIISVLRWDRIEFVADSFRQGRVFLAGDAAHQNSPTGGLGMNTGFADAVDLGWKLAAVVKGWGGERLLDSYDAERRPVASRNAAACSTAFRETTGLPTDPALDDDTPAGEAARARYAAALKAEVRAAVGSVPEQIKLGFCYEGSPVVWPDGTPPLPVDGAYIPSTRPGTRAPHGWLTDGRSTLDLFGDGFVLLRLGAPTFDVAALVAAAAQRDVPLRVADIADPDIVRLYERKLVLVRPDGHVAWRGDAAPADALAVIDRIRGVAGGAASAAA